MEEIIILGERQNIRTWTGDEMRVGNRADLEWNEITIQLQIYSMEV